MSYEKTQQPDKRSIIGQVHATIFGQVSIKRLHEIPETLENTRNHRKTISIYI